MFIFSIWRLHLHAFPLRPGKRKRDEDGRKKFATGKHSAIQERGSFELPIGGNEDDIQLVLHVNT